MTMTTKQRAGLRAMANTIDPILHIGKDGINDNLAKQAWDALEARELIKATVLQNAPLTAREACEALCERVHAEPVQVIGNRFVIYRKARKDSKIDLDAL
ncbi:MAG: YhbY family RNA-binding protein [Clostridia bacterium]|nr:YhbY family RNA-binding protein [Clostridia bacterium]MBR4441916.1 YhbY family RNA-binding protein [Clostridia bacterium]